MKRYLALLLSLLLLLPVLPALAEDVFTLDQSVFAVPNVEDAAYAPSLTTDRSYVEIVCPVESDTAVSLTICGAGGEVVYSRDYGSQSGTFRSEDVYLRLDGAATTYRATLSCGSATYAFPIYRVMGRLTGNKACSQGYPLAQLSGGDTWQTVTLLDMAALSGTSFTCELHASNRVNLGTVTFSVQDGAVTTSVSLRPEADATVDKARVFVARTALEAGTLGKKDTTALATDLDTPASVGTGVVAVYVRLTVSYDPAGISGTYGDSDLPGQAELWERMQTETFSEAVG